MKSFKEIANPHLPKKSRGKKPPAPYINPNAPKLKPQLAVCSVTPLIVHLYPEILMHRIKPDYTNPQKSYYAVLRELFELRKDLLNLLNIDIIAS